MQRFLGTLDRRQGTFVLQGSEGVETGKIKATWFVFPDRGQVIFPGCAARAALNATLGKGPTERWTVGSSDGNQPMPGIRIAIVYHSSYSHTGRQIEAVKCGVERVEGAKALLPRVDEAQARWGDLTFAEDVIYLPTCTGGPPAQFKAFEDASSHAVMTSGLWLER